MPENVLDSSFVSCSLSTSPTVSTLAYWLGELKQEVLSFGLLFRFRNVGPIRDIVAKARGSCHLHIYTPKVEGPKSRIVGRKSLFSKAVNAIIRPIKTTITGMATTPNPTVDPWQTEGSKAGGRFHSGGMYYLLTTSKGWTHLNPKSKIRTWLRAPQKPQVNTNGRELACILVDSRFKNCSHSLEDAP